MSSVEDWAEIRRLYRAEGFSSRECAGYRWVGRAPVTSSSGSGTKRGLPVTTKKPVPRRWPTSPAAVGRSSRCSPSVPSTISTGADPTRSGPLAPNPRAGTSRSAGTARDRGTWRAAARRRTSPSRLLPTAYRGQPPATRSPGGPRTRLAHDPQSRPGRDQRTGRVPLMILPKGPGPRFVTIRRGATHATGRTTVRRVARPKARVQIRSVRSPRGHRSWTSAGRTGRGTCREGGRDATPFCPSLRPGS